MSAAQTLDLPVLERAFRFDAEAIDAENRTVQVVASTENAVVRWFGREVLSHSPDAVDLERFNGGAPVLHNHNRGQQIGVVVPGSARLEKGRLKATMRFSANDFPQAVFRDIVDGIRQAVSIGYRVHNFQVQKSNAGEPKTHVADSWEPLEVSVVSVPADPAAKVGRSDGWDEKQPVTINHFSDTMNDDEKRAETPETNATRTAATPAPAVDTEAIRQAGFEDGQEKGREEGKREAKEEFNREQRRRNDITELAKTHNRGDDEVKEWTRDDGGSVDEYRAHILSELAKGHTPVGEPPSRVGRQENRDMEQFSLNKLIADMTFQGRKLDGAELEAVQEGQRQAKENGLTPRGVMIGDAFLMSARERELGTEAYVEEQRQFYAGQRDVTVGSGGGATVQTSLMGLYDFLRPRLQVRALGATFMTGLRDSVDLPVKSRGTPPTHKAEVAEADEYDWSSAVVSLRPKRLPVVTELSQQLILQGARDPENYTRRTLGWELAAGMDNSAINGSGAGNVPRGVLNTTGVGEVDLGASGGTWTWAKAVELETNVATSNGDIGVLAMLTNPTVRGTLKTTAKETNQAVYLWDTVGTNDRTGGGMVNGYRAEVSTHLGTGNTAVHGYWNELTIAEWGGLEILTDRATKFSQGLVRVHAARYYDHAVPRPAVFAKTIFQA